MAYQIPKPITVDRIIEKLEESKKLLSNEADRTTDLRKKLELAIREHALSSLAFWIHEEKLNHFLYEKSILERNGKKTTSN